MPAEFAALMQRAAAPLLLDAVILHDAASLLPLDTLILMPLRLYATCYDTLIAAAAAHYMPRAPHDDMLPPVAAAVVTLRAAAASIMLF